MHWGRISLLGSFESPQRPALAERYVGKRRDGGCGTAPLGVGAQTPTSGRDHVMNAALLCQQDPLSRIR
jgi:hypothetical protein